MAQQAQADKSSLPHTQDKQETKTQDTRTQAVQKKARRFNLVWLMPLLALLVTGILLWQNTLNKGPVIEVYLDSAEGIEAGKTAVKVRSVTVGRVESVKLDDSYTKAVLSVQMEPDTEQLLKEDTSVWLVKARVEYTGISGLNTLLSGSYLEMMPGQSENSSRTFTALNDPPALPSDQHGVTIKLLSSGRKQVSYGDYVSYCGFTVGRVTGARLNLQDGTISYEAVITEPYTSLLNASTRFWVSSGVDVSFTPEGVRLHTQSLDSILRGGIEFDNVNDDRSAEPLDIQAEHTLFDNATEAELDALSDGLQYVVMLPHDLRSIKKGSQIYFRNVQIGSVIAAPAFSGVTELLKNDSHIPVLIALNVSAADREFVRTLLHQKLQQHTLCAGISSSNLISGDNRLDLLLDEQTCTFDTASWQGKPVIPAVAGATLQDKFDAVIKKLDDIDLSGISNEIKQALASTSQAMQAFTQSNDQVKRTQLLEKMTTSFENFNKAMQSYSEDSPMYNDLRNTVQSIDTLLKEIAPAVTELGQQPNAIIFGSSQQDITPRKGGQK